jgi:serine/threonine protein kinase
VDLYSLGVTLYVLLCGFLPSFSINDKDDVNVMIFLSTCDVLDDVKRLIRNLLDQDFQRKPKYEYLFFPLPASIHDRPKLIICHSTLAQQARTASRL